VCAALGALNIRRPLGPDREATEARTTLLQDIGQGIGFVSCSSGWWDTGAAARLWSA
jgi:hypothetical protein